LRKDVKQADNESDLYHNNHLIKGAINMQKGIYVLFVFLLSLLVVIGCQKNTTSVNDEGNTGTLKLYLTDAPSAIYDSVNITFSQVSAHHDSSWIVLMDSLMTVNLMDLTNGHTIVFGSADVPAGHYTQIRIKILDSYVVVDGQKHMMSVPSGATSGLKFGPEFTVSEGSTYEMIVDFDVHRSIVTTGPRSHPHGYKLKPRIRICPKALTGAINGTLTNPEHLPVAYAIQNSDTITSAIPDSTSGYFILSFLPAGTYLVSVRDTLDQSYDQSGVMVTAGEKTDLGSITLQ
jgi:hypothetical protein